MNIKDKIISLQKKLLFQQHKQFSLLIQIVKGETNEFLLNFLDTQNKIKILQNKLTILYSQQKK